MGHCVSVGAKGQWGSLGEIEMTAIFKGLREFTLLNSGNSTDDP
jgi:hypothetical protein